MTGAMKYFVFFTIVTAWYVWKMKKPVREICTDRSAENLYENQTIPNLVLSTVLYGLLLYKGAYTLLCLWA